MASLEFSVCAYQQVRVRVQPASSSCRWHHLAGEVVASEHVLFFKAFQFGVRVQVCYIGKLHVMGVWYTDSLTPELLTSSDPPTSASQSVWITGVSHQM